ncbi:MAG: response regulator, partial [Methanosarcinales archaeon]
GGGAGASGASGSSASLPHGALAGSGGSMGGIARSGTLSGAGAAAAASGLAGSEGTAESGTEGRPPSSNPSQTDVTVGSGSGYYSSGSVTGSTVTAFEGYDLVLMDLHLSPGGMDGYQTTAFIRSQPGGADIPVIAMTGAVGDDDKVRCQRAGMQGFLCKPIDKGQLAEVIVRYADSW